MRSGALFLLILAGAAAPTYGQARYERATVPLRGELLRPSPIQKSPDASSSPVIMLRATDEVVVRGRQGEWFQVDFSNSQGLFVGWVPSSAVKVLGPVKTASPPVPSKSTETPVPEQAPVMRESRSEGKKPSSLRVVPKLGFSYGAKDFPSQYRGGVDILSGVWPGVEAGGTLEIAAREQFTVAFGPTITYVLPWPVFGGVHFVPFAGARGYVVSSNAGGTNGRGGFSLGMNVWLMRMGSALFLLNAGADILMFGSSKVAVPISTLLGVAFTF